MKGIKGFQKGHKRFNWNVKQLDITGKKFGKLVAIKSLKSKGNGQFDWLFKCECGKYKIARKSNVIRGNTRSCGCLMKEVKKPSGKFAYNWKGGTTEILKRVQSTLKYRQWRSDVFTRDLFVCQDCGDKSGGNLEAHHIKQISLIFKENSINTYENAMECEELWNLNNGITLCKKCHKKTENWGRKSFKFLKTISRSY